jgi:hypothetical protein
LVLFKFWNGRHGFDNQLTHFGHTILDQILEDSIYHGAKSKLLVYFFKREAAIIKSKGSINGCTFKKIIKAYLCDDTYKIFKIKLSQD